MKYPLPAMTLNYKEYKRTIQPIVKFGLTKAGIISTLHMAVRYGPRSLGGIGIFFLIVIQGAGQIAFLIKYYWKPTPSSQLLRDKLSTLQIKTGQGGRTLEKNHPKTQ